MKTVPVENAVGKVLCHDITRIVPGFYKGRAFRKGCIIQPEDVTYAADSRYIFVVDAATDSLYQFTSTGYEGVRPPVQSGERKNIIVSFGGTGSGPTQFNEPHGVAYYQGFNTLLVADTGNDRIVRFKLSTDIQ